MIELLYTTAPDFEAAFRRIEDRNDAAAAKDVEDTVRAIITDVARRGDDAVVDYTRRFDDRPGLVAQALEVPPAELDAALAALDPAIRRALERAHDRLRAFHEAQGESLLAARWDDGRGVVAELVVRPLARAGLYVPGGTAAYPSTVLMNAVPAKVAKVAEVVM